MSNKNLKGSGIIVILLFIAIIVSLYIAYKSISTSKHYISPVFGVTPTIKPTEASLSASPKTTTARPSSTPTPKYIRSSSPTPTIFHVTAIPTSAPTQTQLPTSAPTGTDGGSNGGRIFVGG